LPIVILIVYNFLNSKIHTFFNSKIIFLILVTLIIREIRDDKIRIIIKNKNHNSEINKEEVKENLEKNKNRK